MPKAILFDNDGTLVNTEGLFFESCCEILAEHGVTLTKEWYTDHVMKRHESLGVLLGPAGYTAAEIKMIREKRNERYRQKMQGNVTYFKGAIDLLSYLSPKYPLALVTSSERRHLDIILEHVPIRPYFQLIIANEDVENWKPHPEPYLKAARFFGLEPQDCLVIEDSERGVTAAKKAGMTCFVIPNGLSLGNDFSQADKILGSLSELMRYL